MNNTAPSDVLQSISQAQLIFVSDSQEGIARKKRGKAFVYLYKGKQVKDDNSILRIQRLAIPPAWNGVWICKAENGHLQATGKDARNRKQYRYHPEWSRLRNENKFHRMMEFGKALPKLRDKIQKDMRQSTLNLNKVIATAIHLMDNTHIRIGNKSYEKENGTHGLTTLKDKHVKFNADSFQICFKGKKGIIHTIELKDKKLAKILRQCRDIPGKELFQYLDENNEYRPIDSGQVNNYIKEATGKDFTAKDFRTWAGTLHALSAFKDVEYSEVPSILKRNMVAILDKVSVKLGNTRTVCRKYYVNPVLFSMYEQNKLHAYLPSKNNGRLPKVSGLTSEEKILMRILKGNS